MAVQLSFKCLSSVCKPNIYKHDESKTDEVARMALKDQEGIFVSCETFATSDDMIDAFDQSSNSSLINTPLLADISIANSTNINTNNHKHTDTYTPHNNTYRHAYNHSNKDALHNITRTRKDTSIFTIRDVEHEHLYAIKNYVIFNCTQSECFDRIKDKKEIKYFGRCQNKRSACRFRSYRKVSNQNANNNKENEPPDTVYVDTLLFSSTPERDYYTSEGDYNTDGDTDERRKLITESVSNYGSFDDTITQTDTVDTHPSHTKSSFCARLKRMFYIRNSHTQPKQGTSHQPETDVSNSQINSCEGNVLIKKPEETYTVGMVPTPSELNKDHNVPYKAEPDKNKQRYRYTKLHNSDANYSFCQINHEIQDRNDNANFDVARHPRCNREQKACTNHSRVNGRHILHLSGEKNRMQDVNGDEDSREHTDGSTHTCTQNRTKTSDLLSKQIVHKNINMSASKATTNRQSVRASTDTSQSQKRSIELEQTYKVNAPMARTEKRGPGTKATMQKRLTNASLNIASNRRQSRQTARAGHGNAFSTSMTSLFKPEDYHYDVKDLFNKASEMYVPGLNGEILRDAQLKGGHASNMGHGVIGNIIRSSINYVADDIYQRFSDRRTSRFTSSQQLGMPGSHHSAPNNVSSGSSGRVAQLNASTSKHGSDDVPTPDGIKVKISKSVALAGGDGPENLNQFDSLNPQLVPVVDASEDCPYRRRSLQRPHMEELAKLKALATTEETPHLQFAGREAFRRLCREDCHLAFTKVRIPTLRKSPAHIVWPSQAPTALDLDTSEEQAVMQNPGRTLSIAKVDSGLARRTTSSRVNVYHRAVSPTVHNHTPNFIPWRSEAADYKNNTIRIDQHNVGSLRFHPWAPYDEDKIKLTRCDVLSKSVINNLPHQSKDNPLRFFSKSFPGSQPDLTASEGLEQHNNERGDKTRRDSMTKKSSSKGINAMFQNNVLNRMEGEITYLIRK